MPKRLPYEALIVAALALGSCQRRTATDERLEVAEVNVRRAAAASSAMVDRVERLERRVGDLEAKR